MISVTLYGRLGNHLWQYAVCRTIAEQKKYEYHIPRNFLGTQLFDCSLGVEQDLTNKCFPVCNNHDQMQKYDPEIFNIEDFTKIDGYLQTEKYIKHNKKNILNWFRPKHDTNKIKEELKLDEDICIISFRGGDYKDKPHLYLNIKFYYDSINYMKYVNPNIKFIIVTDDPEEAKNYFSDYPIYNYGMIGDFYAVQFAKYLIITNSTFSWWASWLNTCSKLTIFPKYWLRHNISEGWWMPSDSLTEGCIYIDRNGKIQTYNQCLLEISDINYESHY